MNTIFTTFGTEKILNDIKNKYPDRNMIMLTSSDEKFQLLDLSGAKTVFANPITYSIIDQKSNSYIGEYFDFFFLSIPIEELKAFDKKIQYKKSVINDITNVILLKSLSTDYNRIILIISNSQDAKKSFSTIIAENEFSNQNFYHLHYMLNKRQ